MHEPARGSATVTLAELVNAQRGDIVARFVSEMERRELSPRGVSRPLLIDEIPSFLDEIVEQLAHGEKVRITHEVSDQSPTARRHGHQRWSLGYDLELVVREYGVLRHVIVETARAAGVSLSNDEFEVLAKCLNVGIAEAVTAYVRFRDQQLEAQKANFEFLAHAGQLLSASLDYKSTLASVTRSIVPRLADWCVIHLDGTPLEESAIAHASAHKADLLRELFRRFPPSPDARHGFPEILRSGKTQLVEHVAPNLLEELASSPEHLALLRQLAPRSWIAVPLTVLGAPFGVITFVVGESGRSYGPPDLLLVEELARRAATAIDNARLYELSQRERSRVEGAMRAKDEFVATLSHELRTPLHAILGWVRMLRTGTLAEAKHQHAYEVIERNANAQSQLVADLLDISRVITGRIRLRPAQLDLSEVIATTLEDAQTSLDAKHIRVHRDLEPAVLWGDTERLQQVVWNLVSNAIKFTPEGGELWIELRRLDSELVLRVRDTGVGIDPEFLPHVFDRFRQSDSGFTRAHGGLGLGLSIARHLVELHDGSISAQSGGTGKGATFVVRLPLGALVSTTVDVSQVRAAVERSASSLEPRDELRGVSVLVVDDEQDARDLLSVLLETSGMTVRTAISAADAMHQLERAPPNIIISDIGMPGEDGCALIRGIRSLASDKQNIPAIALTAFASGDDRARALVAGFNRCLAKPVEMVLLLGAMSDLVGGQQR